jgi:hypothetical protein
MIGAVCAHDPKRKPARAAICASGSIVSSSASEISPFLYLSSTSASLGSSASGTYIRTVLVQYTGYSCSVSTVRLGRGTSDWDGWHARHIPLVVHALEPPDHNCRIEGHAEDHDPRGTIGGAEGDKGAEVGQRVGDGDDDAARVYQAEFGNAIQEDGVVRQRGGEAVRR